MPHMINDIHHLHKGGVAMLWVEGETCHIKFRSDGADTTIEFSTKIANLQERAANIQQNNMQSFSGAWERNMMQSLCSTGVQAFIQDQSNSMTQTQNTYLHLSI